MGLKAKVITAPNSSAFEERLNKFLVTLTEEKIYNIIYQTTPQIGHSVIIFYRE